MVEFVNDQDRAEAVKKWLSKYAGTIIVGIILGLAAMYGIQYWQTNQKQDHEEASMAFQQLIAMPSDQDSKAYIAQAKGIVGNYPKTPYASLSSFLLAKYYVDYRQYDNAISQLQWVLDNGSDKQFKQIAAIRASRIYMFLKQYDKANTVLDKLYTPSFNVMVDEQRGDIALAQGNVAKARDLYAKALEDNPDSSVLQPLLTTKLHILPEQSSTGAQ